MTTKNFSVMVTLLFSILGATARAGTNIPPTVGLKDFPLDTRIEFLKDVFVPATQEKGQVYSVEEINCSLRVEQPTLNDRTLRARSRIFGITDVQLASRQVTFNLNDPTGRVVAFACAFERDLTLAAMVSKLAEHVHFLFPASAFEPSDL